MRPAMMPVAVLLIASILSSCGGGGGTLQSISVSPSSASGSAQYVATGTYSDGRKVTPLPVQWFIIDVPAIDPAPAYQLSATPFSQLCLPGESGSFLVSAFAPQDPKSPTAGAMPENVWWDMIHANVQSQGGFVDGSAHLNCP